MLTLIPKRIYFGFSGCEKEDKNLVVHNEMRFSEVTTLMKQFCVQHLEDTQF